MHWFNVRVVKNNPGKALPAATEPAWDEPSMQVFDVREGSE